jgi:predicted ATPase/DNA-binding CsgD family transcriptional regulator
VEPAATRARTANNLNPQATPLIGREHDLETIQQCLLREDVRLVTLTGPGGTGKTRLAIACAEQMLQHFYDGVYFVDLTPLQHARLVMSTIARTLQLQMSSGNASDTLLRFLDGKCVLLVLDNFEHVQAAALEVSALVSGCSGLKVLVTSRAPLHLRWEHEVPVPPLPLPDLSMAPDVKELLKSASVALFFARAHAVRPDFVPVQDTADTVARICVRLDGLPLALELAAVRIRVLAAQDLLSLLEQRLDPLASGALDAPLRHRSLRATVNWSHDLLSPSERMLFRRLSIFAGGWSLEAAQTVCCGGNLAGPAVVDMLGRLVDQSLVQLEVVQSRSRFRMLETLRQFALEQLEGSGGLEDCARRHAEYFLSVAELFGPEPRVFGAEATTVRAELEVEQDNMRAALRWFIDHGEADLALRMADALQSFWYVRGPYAETRRTLEEVLAMPGARAPTALRASLLNGAGMAAYMNGDVETGQVLNERALALARTTNNLAVAGRALQSLANVAEMRGDFARARTYAEEALTNQRRIGNRFRETILLSNLGRQSWRQGDLAAAYTLAEQALAIGRPLGSPWLISNALLILGTALRDQGKLSTARVTLEEALALSRQGNDARMIAYCLDALGRIALEQGRHREAREQLAESLRLFWELGERARVPDSLESHAQLAAASGGRDAALRLAGAAMGLRAILRVAVPARMQISNEAWVDEARTALGHEMFDTMLSSGQAMSADDAVRYALSLQQSSSTDTLASLWSPLTRREQEVARLVARGRSNRQIAAELVVTEATAAKHVENIREKLGLSSRTQIAAWVRDREAAVISL